jgi:hypothetical protein
MTGSEGNKEAADGRAGLAFIAASLVVFLVIAGCVVYFVAKVVF